MKNFLDEINLKNRIITTEVKFIDRYCISKTKFLFIESPIKIEFIEDI